MANVNMLCRGIGRSYLEVVIIEFVLFFLMHRDCFFTLYAVYTFNVIWTDTSEKQTVCHSHC